MLERIASPLHLNVKQKPADSGGYFARLKRLGIPDTVIQALRHEDVSTIVTVDGLRRRW